MVLAGLAANLPSSLYNGLIQAAVPATVAQSVAHLPPTAALFAAFLGYNPMGTLIPASVLQNLSAAAQASLTGKTFFPTLIAGPFEQGLRVAFSISVALSLLAAFASLLRGQRFIYEHTQLQHGQAAATADRLCPTRRWTQRSRRSKP